MPVEFINPAAIHTPTGYSHVAKTGSLVSIAGQLAIDKDGNVVGEGDIQAQTKQALSNLEEAVKASGGTKEDIAAIRVYMTNRDDLEGMRQARTGFWEGTPPASTLLFISGLVRPEFLIEIEALAVVDG